MAIDPTGGLNSLVSSEAENMYGMPQQALEQRAKVSGATMDAIVARKALEMKKQAKAALDAETQPSPDTIVAQNEKALMESIQQETSGTLGDLAKRTQGTMAQKQRLQGQNMQRAAAGTPRPPQQPQRRPMPPQAQGLAGARMAQAAQAGGPKMMAQGGIVGYAEGKRVGSRVKERVKELGIDLATFNALPEEQQRAIMKQISDQSTAAAAGQSLGYAPAQITDKLYRNPMAAIGNLGIAAAESRVGRAIGLGDAADPMTPFEYNPNVKKIDAAVEKNLAPDGTDFRDLLPVGSNTGTPLQMPPEGPASLMPPNPDGSTAVPPPPVPTPAPEITKPEDQGLGGLDATPQTAGAVELPNITTENRTNVDEAVQAGFAQADANSNRDSNIASMEDRLAALDEYDAETYRTPEEQASREVQSFLVGMGNTGNLGSAMRGGLAAMSNEERISRSNGRKRLIDKFEKQKDIATTDKDFAQMGIQLGTQLASDAAANERNIRDTATRLTTAQMTAATADADRIVQRENNMLVAADKKVQREIDKAKNQSYDDRTRLTAAIKVAGEVAGTRDAIRATEVENNQELQMLEMQMMEANEDEDTQRMQEIQREMTAIRRTIDITVEAAVNAANLTDKESTANEVIEDLMDDVSITNTTTTP